MDSSRIRQQSESAYKQWKVQWRDHATQHAKFKQATFEDFENIGVGKACLIVANGYSLEEEIETIKKYQNKVDILCCDKTLGHLLANGITPTYCLVCDANVNYEKYMEPWKDQLKKVTLFVNVCANPKWTHNGNWKDIYFFVNKDIINSHEEFSNLSGCKNLVVAGTNVSNAMVIMLTQSENSLRRNLFGYDKILLIGFDYSWKHGGKYYAFDETGEGKDQYMRHNYVTGPTGKFQYTSGNLAFSMEWLAQYIKVFQLPVVQCSNDSILLLNGSTPLKLEKQIQYGYRQQDKDVVRDMIKELRKIKRRESEITSSIQKIGRDHYMAMNRSL